MTLTQQRLKELLNYNPETGVFTWKIAPCAWKKAGSIAGCVDQRYFKIRIQYKGYLAHRLAWLYMTGQWPTNHIDHKDGDGFNNRFCNLRDVTKSGNLQNQRKARKDNTTGFLGVAHCNGQWQARIWVENRLLYLGKFSTPESAHEAYLIAKRKYHDTCTI